MTDETTQMSISLTEDAPELGEIGAFGVVLSEAMHWIEDGIHVLSSTEFDVVAGDADLGRAVEEFVEKTEDLFFYLGELDGLSDNENETFVLLAPRFQELFKELERRELARQRRVVIRLRRRGNHVRDWKPRSTPAGSSAALPA